MNSRIKELEAQIKKHNHLYWVENNPEISDIEYDNLVRELEALDPENPILQELGSEELASSEKKIVHEHQMLSLGKIYSKEELVKWVKKLSRTPGEAFLIQPKYDGISGKFEKGILSSRGDGKIGIDYSDKIPLIEIESDEILPPPQEIQFLLGEIVITNHNFNTLYNGIKSKAGTKFKNQRNAVAGIMGTDDTDFYKKQNAVLTFVDYNKNSWFTTCENFENEWDEILNVIQDTSNYPLDGIVIVSSPQELVSMIVEKAVNMAKMMNIPVLGLVENMSYVLCPDCGKKINVFGESHIKEVTEDFGIDLLARIPMDPKLTALVDKGWIEMMDNDYLEEAAQIIDRKLSAKNSTN